MFSSPVNKITGVIFLFAVGAIGIALYKANEKNVPNTPIAIATTTKQQPPLQITTTVIGRSLQGRDIEVYSYGNGNTHLTFVGGIHGGYEWNSVLLAYKVIDYLNKNPTIIPKTITIDIIPSLNPDALYKVTGKDGRFDVEDVVTDKKILTSARFNANNVDLNRNFDCQWQPKSTWQSKTVSAGSAAFSEPEARALKEFIFKERPSAVVFWHSQANGVYASQCGKGILEATRAVMNTYATASGYPAIETFDAYVVTGAAEDWLASIGTPAVTVELKTHETIELEQNLSGVRALINYFK